MVAARIIGLRSKRVNKRNLYNNLRAELEPGFICTFSNNTGVSLPHFFPEKRCPHRLVEIQLLLGAGKVKREKRKKETELVFFKGLFVPGLSVAPNKNGGTASAGTLAGTKNGVLRLHKISHIY